MRRGPSRLPCRLVGVVALARGGILSFDPARQVCGRPCQQARVRSQLGWDRPPRFPRRLVGPVLLAVRSVACDPLGVHPSPSSEFREPVSIELVVCGHVFKCRKRLLYSVVRTLYIVLDTTERCNQQLTDVYEDLGHLFTVNIGGGGRRSVHHACFIPRWEEREENIR